MRVACAGDMGEVGTVLVCIIHNQEKTQCVEPTE